MDAKKKIRLLIVDDSMLFRQMLASKIAIDPSIEVVATAADPYEARDKILEFEPDVMTLDVEMPKMNGIEFLRKLMPQYPIPVVVVSAISNNVFDALNAGAVDFVTKLDVRTGIGLDSLINELIVKIKIASVANVKKLGKAIQSNSVHEKSVFDASKKIIAIVASTGGTEAIFQVLKSMPKDIPGTVITQHMPPVFTKMYADRLNNSCLMEVKEAKDGDLITQGRVLLAPGDYHMRINKSIKGYFVECFKGDRVNGHCPSVDILFDSVAQYAKNNAIGVILTGMGYDGAKGLLNMRKNGARTIGQDEKSSVVYGMPKVAFDIGAVEKQVSIENITQTIFSMLK